MFDRSARYFNKSGAMPAVALDISKAFVSDRSARGFNKSLAMPAVALGISKAFDRVWHTGLLHKLGKLEPYSF